MLERRRMDVAAHRFEHAVRLDPKHSGARLFLAFIYSQRFPPGTYEPERAAAHFEEILKHVPDRFDIRLEYARWLVEKEVRLVYPWDPDRVSMDSSWTLEVARSQLDRVLDQAPPASEEVRSAHALMGELLLKLGDFEAARQRLGYVLANYSLSRPSLARAHQKIGHCQWRQGDFRGAAGSFARAYDADPHIEYLWDIRMAWELLGGYPPGFPAPLRFELRPERVEGADRPLLRFTDRARELGIDKWAGAGPSAWADVDGDGRQDLLACGCDTFCTLWRNDGRTFTDVTLRAGLGRLESGFSAAFADYDNDGDMDFYVARNGWSGPAGNALMRNRGDGTFEDVTPRSGAEAPGSSFNAAWADFNRDGWLDLVVTQGVTADGSVNRLFYGKGDGTFTDVTESSGILEPPGIGTIGLAVGDYDSDGWPDLFVHGRFGPNRLYRNQGDGRFVDVAGEAGVGGDGRQNGYAAFFSDLDADGDLDIFAASLADWPRVLQGYRPGDAPSGPDAALDTPRYWRYEGGGRFSDQTRAANLVRPLGVMSAGIADLDNDGYPDVYLGTGSPDMTRLEPNVLLRNLAGGRFEDVTRSAGVGLIGKGHGVTFIDWDRDGDLDVYVEMGGFYHGDFWRSAFFVNELGNRNNWLDLTLEQGGLNRHAIGAGVTLRAGAYRLYQEVKAGEGFGSTNPTTLHFGLGRRTSVDALDIRWPDGTRETLARPPINRRLRFRRGDVAWMMG